MNLKVLEILNQRMRLTKDVQQHYLNLKKGYEGEMLFDSLMDVMKDKFIILNDLLLEVNNTTFQIDSLFIMEDRICLYEVKNYEGDFYYESERFFKNPGYELINPLDQMNRGKTW